MLKKIAHNSTINSLNTGLPLGNKDLKPLQDLISLEKNIIVSLQRLSSDIGKSAEALKTWGLGEGEDLGDTLTASTTLLLQFANALSQYGAHEITIREQMKSVRTREEALDEMKRRRKAVVAKAEASEKKLNKMSPEHKNLAMQTETLNQLRDQIRQMDSEILVEEAAIGDFKRTSTRMWMSLKFGGLQECTEKGTIAAEYGKLIIANIPDEVTQPGYSRPMYQGHGKTQSLVEEANLAINDITMSSGPNIESRPPRFDGLKDLSPPGSAQAPGSSWPPESLPSNMLSTPQDLGHGHFMDVSDTSGVGYDAPPQPPPDFGSPQFPTASHVPAQSIDDFGIQRDIVSNDESNGGRFATFPVKTPGGPRGVSLRDDPPSLRSRPDEGDDSFSSSIAAALGPSGYDGEHNYPAPSGPPPGAAPAANPSEKRSSGSPSLPAYSEHIRKSTISTNSDGGLAYMAEGDDPHDLDKQSRFDPGPVAPLSPGYASHAGQEVDATYNLESPSGDLPYPGSPSRRVPPPTFDPEEEAKSRNAAAAEEIKREMDALSSFGDRPSSFSLVSPPPAEPVTAPLDLSPPSAPFARRSVSPHPNVEIPKRSSFYNAGPTDPIAVSPTAYSKPPSPEIEGPNPSSPRIHAPTPSLSLSADRPELRPTFSGGGSDYGTPLESPHDIYPRNMYANKSSTSLSSTAPMGSATGKISAAAFRRPQNRVGSADLRGGSMGSDTSPLSVKKRLPSSPYPENRTPSGFSRDGSSADVGARNASPLPPPASPLRKEDDDFDYIGAYVDQNDDPLPPPASSSPPYADYGRLGKVVIANEQSPPASRFADGNADLR